MLKTCSKCNRELEISCFYRRSDRPGGRISVCRSCCNERVKAWRLRDPDGWREWDRKRYRRVKLKVRAQKLKSRYNITASDYDKMLAGQGGVCAICSSGVPGGHGAYFHVDHDHETGVIRGLLCGNCNYLLGHAKESITTLLKAIQYLTKEGR